MIAWIQRTENGGLKAINLESKNATDRLVFSGSVGPTATTGWPQLDEIIDLHRGHQAHTKGWRWFHLQCQAEPEA